MPAKGPDTFTILTTEEARRHHAAAAALSAPLLEQLRESGGKPYDAALACYMTCASICKVNGWNPLDFHQWVSAQFPVRD